jgi:hypothetical protein
MSTKGNREPHTLIHRRRFISAAAAISTSALIYKGEGDVLASSAYPSFLSRETVHAGESLANQADFAKISTATVLLPTPTEALAEFLVDMDQTERSILQEYYVLVAIFARRAFNNYIDLKKAISEFQKLVPDLNLGAVSGIKDFTEVGLTGVLYLNASAMTRSTLNNSHTNLLNITSKNLEQLAGSLTEQQGELKLSPEAVRKLREILRQILNLQAPNEDLKKASDALTTASNELSPKVRALETKVSAVLKSLAEAELLEFELYRSNRADVNVLATITEKRTLAFRDVQNVATELENLPSYAPSDELRKRAQAEATPAQIEALQQSSSLPTSMLVKLLNGCATWIKTRYALSSLESRDSTHFEPAAYRQIEAWTQLWGSISAVLSRLIPEASNPRIRGIYWRKWCMKIYSTQEQETILYNLLPRLTPRGERNLRLPENDQSRRSAAQELAQL